MPSFACWMVSGALGGKSCQRRQTFPTNHHQWPPTTTIDHHWPTPHNYGMNSIVGWLLQAFSYRSNWILSCTGKTAIKQQSRTNTYLAVDWWWLYPAIQCMCKLLTSTHKLFIILIGIDIKFKHDQPAKNQNTTTDY